MSDLTKILVDSREQRPWRFPGVATEVRALRAGDYSIDGLEHRVAIERKSISDLVGTLTFGRERFERELDILHGYERALIVVEGPLNDVIEWKYHSKVSPACLVGSFASFWARHNIPTVFAGSVRNAEILASAFLLKAAKHLGAAPVAA